MTWDFAIVFIGLIVQVNQPWSFDNTAVLPYAHGHVAELVVPASALADQGEVQNAFREARRVGDYFIIPLAGLDVRVTGTRGIFNKRSREYQRATPSLTKVGRCSGLRPEILRRTQTDKLASFVDVRGGRMVPHTYLACRLSFDGSDYDDRCSVCSTRYEASLRGQYATLVFTSMSSVRKVRVLKGSELRVRNVVSEETAGPHFRHVYDLYEKCETPLTPIDTGRCSKEICDFATAYPENPPLSYGEGPAYPSTADCTISEHP